MNPEPESKSGDQKKFVYWLNEQDIPRVSEFLTTQGISLNSVGKTPCQVPQGRRCAGPDSLPRCLQWLL